MTTASNRKHLDQAKRLLRNLSADWLRRIKRHRKLPGMASVNPVKITETKYAYMFFIYQPGVLADSLITSVTGSLLTVTGGVNGVQAGKEDEFHNQLFKSFNLPDDIDKTRVSTSYRDGVVKVVVLKKAASGTA